MADRGAPPPRIPCGHPTPEGPCCRQKGHVSPTHWARVYTRRHTVAEKDNEQDQCGARGDPRDPTTPVCILPNGHDGPHKQLVVRHEVIPDGAVSGEAVNDGESPRVAPPHVRLIGEGKMFCWHCGASQRIFPEGGLIITEKAIKAMQLLGEDFEDRHRDCLETDSSPTKAAYRDPHEWRKGPDTGISSLTIYITMMNLPDSHLDGWRPSVPLDGADFGRCYRLLEQFPDWRPRLPEVAERFPAWTGLVGAWDELCALYSMALTADEKGRKDNRHKAAAKQNSQALYHRIHQLTRNPPTTKAP